MREYHLGFHARIVVVLSVQIAKNLKSQITGAVSRSHSPHAEIIFHQVGNLRDVRGVIGKQVKSAFNQFDVAAKILLGCTDNLFDFASSR